MENKKALVIGPLGQDGSFMCDILLSKGYEVYGIIKVNTDPNRLDRRVCYYRRNLNKMDDFKELLLEMEPDEVYNFMGITDVFHPWSNAYDVYQNNFLIPIMMIDSIRESNLNIKFLQASSSLVFGMNKEKLQNEETKRNPIYHYGMAKNFVDEAIKSYRKNFDMNLASAILYPHESERRRDNFFSKKMIDGAVDIKNGKLKRIEVGDINGYRDIGYAKDYMEACHLIMQQDVLDDYVIGSGIPVKTSYFIKEIFRKLGLSPDSIVIKDDLKRGDDLSHLIADNSKIKKLGWKPTKNIDDIIDIMIKHKLNE